MKSDSQVREEVIQELRWDPQVTDPDAIGVAVKDGAVTLTGAVSTYAQKFAAVRAASRVYGVKAVADELTVKPTGEPRDDSDIARAIAHILDNNTRRILPVVATVACLEVRCGEDGCPGAAA